MTTYRTKSVTVEAVQWTGENVEEYRKVWPYEDLPLDSAVGWWFTERGQRLKPEEFPQFYEPLPESTLDLEAIEARLQAVVDCSHDDWKRNLEWGAQYAIADMTDLIAEVKRLRRGQQETMTTYRLINGELVCGEYEFVCQPEYFEWRDEHVETFKDEWVRVSRTVVTFCDGSCPKCCVHEFEDGECIECGAKETDRG